MTNTCLDRESVCNDPLPLGITWLRDAALVFLKGIASWLATFCPLEQSHLTSKSRSNRDRVWFAPDLLDQPHTTGTSMPAV